MNLVKQLRVKKSLTQHELAGLAGTSQPTVAAYESGSKSPTLRTIERFASAVDLELDFGFIPRLTREDRRSLAYHRAIAEKIKVGPAPILSKARKNLKRLRSMHPHAEDLLNRWSKWLELPAEDLAMLIVNKGVTARDMRQVSPFAGVLTPAERTRILHEFRSERETSDRLRVP